MAKRRFQLLVVDDDPALRGTLAALLQMEGYDVAVADSLEAGQQAAQTLPDLVLLDLRLGSGKSYDFGRWLSGRGIPFLMLSGETSSLEKVLTLELGAEDYITKPFDPAEVVARVRARLRTAKPAARTSGNTARFSGWTAHFDRYTLETETGEETTFSHAESAVLRLFLESPKRLISRQYMQEQLGGAAGESFDRAMDVRISRLRTKLGEDPKNPRLIKTIYGAGYIFLGDVGWK